MNKSSVLALSLVVIGIIGLLTVSIMCMEAVPIIEVKAEVTVTDGNPAVMIVTVEQNAVNPLKSPRGSYASFPEVEAKAIINSGRGGVSDWAAKGYHGNGTYDFVIGFPKGVTPKQGDMIKVIVRIVDEKGSTLASDIKVILWE